jgi:predicted DNA binding CopG/RHH family protein
MNVKFKRSELAHVSVRIPKNDLAAIKIASKKMSAGYTTYIRMILRKASHAELSSSI